jgi:protein ImuB
MRRVVSLWLPRFATDRWLRARQQSRQQANSSTSNARSDESQQPLALIEDNAGKLLLAAVNAAAAARDILPGLITVPHEPEVDARALAALAAWCARYTPWTAPGDLTEENSASAGILLDVTGCAHLFGGERALLADLQTRLARFGYAARAALADTAGAAWAMARHATTAEHPCVVVLPGGQRASLAPLPPAALRLPAATAELMDRLGLRRVGDLYPLAPAVLTPRFGAFAVRRLAQALGQEAESLQPRQAPAAHLTRQIFAEPVSDPDDLAGAGRVRQMPETGSWWRRPGATPGFAG